MKTGYGKCSGSKGYFNMAHRLVYWLANDAPEMSGLVVMHTCDNPPCVNPNHLKLGTYQDNMQDAKAKNRLSHFSLKGEESGMSKFSDAQRYEILTELYGGCVPMATAIKWGTNESTMSDVKKGVLWSHIPRLTAMPALRGKSRLGRTKVSRDDAVEIIRMLAEGILAVKIAQASDVSSSTIMRIKKGRLHPDTVRPTWFAKQWSRKPRHPTSAEAPEIDN